MKIKILLTAVLVSFLISCSPNVSEPLNWSFENERIEIIVTGTQETWADPWLPVVHLYVDGALKSSQPCMPVFLSDFNKENIVIEWESGHQGRVVFIQRDGEEIDLILPRASRLLKN